MRLLAFIALGGVALAIPVVPNDPAPAPIAAGCRAYVNQTACSDDKCCNWSALTFPALRWSEPAPEENADKSWPVARAGAGPTLPRRRLWAGACPCCRSRRALSAPKSRRPVQTSNPMKRAHRSTNASGFLRRLLIQKAWGSACTTGTCASRPQSDLVWGHHWKASMCPMIAALLAQTRRRIKQMAGT